MALPLGPARARFSVLGVVLSVAAPTESARAYDASVEASLDVQYYSVASPFGEPVVSRRRYSSTLGLDLLNLQGPARWNEPTLGFRTRFRIDADFGIQAGERELSSDAYLPGLRQAPLDLMVAYLEGENFGGGLFGFRLGRQVLIDGMGFWSFDGALVRVVLPVHLELSGYAGFEPRAAPWMLSTPRFASDGVWRGDRSALQAWEYPSFLEDTALAPAAGIALKTIGLGQLQAGIAYRTIQNRSRVLISPFPSAEGELSILDQARTSSERAVASARLDLSDGSVSTDVVYDLYLDRFTDLAAAIDWNATSRLSVGFDVDHLVPSYDADSIFNWFWHGANTRALGRLSFAPSQILQTALGWGFRFFQTNGDPSLPAAPDGAPERSSRTLRHTEVLLNASAHARFASTSLSLSGIAEHGETGHRGGADLSVTRTYLGGRYDGLIVLSLYDWSDALRPSRSATSFSYVLGAGLLPSLELSGQGRLGVEWEHSMNRLVGQRFRLLCTLDLTVLR